MARAMSAREYSVLSSRLLLSSTRMRQSCSRKVQWSCLRKSEVVRAEAHGVGHGVQRQGLAVVVAHVAQGAADVRARALGGAEARAHEPFQRVLQQAAQGLLVLGALELRKVGLAELVDAVRAGAALDRRAGGQGRELQRAGAHRGKVPALAVEHIAHQVVQQGLGLRLAAGAHLGQQRLFPLVDAGAAALRLLRLVDLDGLVEARLLVELLLLLHEQRALGRQQRRQQALQQLA